MRVKILALVILLLGFGVILNRPTELPETVQATETVAKPDNQIKPAEILDAKIMFALVNQERINAGITPLEWNLQLEQSANQKCQDIVTYSNFSHTNNDGTEGTDYAIEWLPRASYWGENLTQQYYSGNAFFVKTWMDSKLHKENILDTEYERSAIYICDLYPNKNGMNLYTAVQHFAD